MIAQDREMKGINEEGKDGPNGPKIRSANILSQILDMKARQSCFGDINGKVRCLPIDAWPGNFKSLYNNIDWP